MARPGGVPKTLLYRIYTGLTLLLVPLAYAVVSRKLRRQGVPVLRIHERLGHASKPRPPGTLIWFHAASVGESLSVLALIRSMGERLPKAQFLITSGTATSAALIAKRMPPRTRHQYAPLDSPGPVRRFLSHWIPNAGVFVESELWPLMLAQARASGTRLALLNARLSDRSVRRWKKRAKTAKYTLDQFDILLTQNDKTATNLLMIGADPDRVHPGSNLKSTAAPLPIDAGSLAEIQDSLQGRPVWVASSTHPGEEAIVLAAHTELLTSHPDLCLILVPRHPERGDAVAQLIDAAGMTCARRTLAEGLRGKQVYLADTLGETGTWYATASIVFLGGSMFPIGGHNPFEPAQAGAAILTGMHVTNFAETFLQLQAAGGAVTVADADDLARSVAIWLDQPERRQKASKANSEFVAGQQSRLDEVVTTLCQALALETPDG